MCAAARCKTSAVCAMVMVALASRCPSAARAQNSICPAAKFARGWVRKQPNRFCVAQLVVDKRHVVAVLDAPSVVSVLLAQQSAGSSTQGFVVWIDGVVQGVGTYQASFTTQDAPDDQAYPYALTRTSVRCRDLHMYCRCSTSLLLWVIFTAVRAQANGPGSPLSAGTQ